MDDRLFDRLEQAITEYKEIHDAAEKETD